MGAKLSTRPTFERKVAPNDIGNLLDLDLETTS